jgi:hypothetical protein
METLVSIHPGVKFKPFIAQTGHMESSQMCSNSIRQILIAEEYFRRQRECILLPQLQRVVGKIRSSGFNPLTSGRSWSRKTYSVRSMYLAPAQQQKVCTSDQVALELVKNSSSTKISRLDGIHKVRVKSINSTAIRLRVTVAYNFGFED